MFHFKDCPVHIHIHTGPGLTREALEAVLQEAMQPFADGLETLNIQTEAIMATQTEVAQTLNDLAGIVGKIGAESAASLQHIASLESALAAAGNSTPEVDAALANLRTSLQAVDDLVADAPGTAPDTGTTSPPTDTGTTSPPTDGTPTTPTDGTVTTPTDTTTPNTGNVDTSTGDAGTGTTPAEDGSDRPAPTDGSTPDNPPVQP